MRTTKKKKGNELIQNEQRGLRTATTQLLIIDSWSLCTTFIYTIKMKINKKLEIIMKLVFTTGLSTVDPTKYVMLQ